MKLAVVTPNGEANCLLCNWNLKAPLKKRDYKLKQSRELTQEEKVELLEKSVLSHLKSSHDRMLLTREEGKLVGEGGNLRAYYYHGRRPQRGER